MDAKGAVALLRDVGIGRIAEFDGCLCCSVEIKNVHIDVSCRKSSGVRDFRGMLVRVYSSSLDATFEGLRCVAVEVAGQLRELDSWTPMAVRFCDYDDDRKCRCTYCGEPRQNQAGYLCGSCLERQDAGGSVAERWDYARIVFDPPPPKGEA